MAVTRTLTLWCEGVTSKGHPCHVWTVGGGTERTAAELRRHARRYGWVRRGGRDYCGPDHIPEGVTPTSSISGQSGP